MSEIYEVADAVKDRLNALVASNDLLPSFTAQRVYLPLVDMEEDIDELRVMVVPKSDGLAPSSRDRSSEEIEIDIGVIQHLQPDAEPTAAGPSTFTAACDGLVKLCRAISLIYSGTSPMAGDAKWMKTIYDPIFDPGMLKDNRTFRARITMTFYQALHTT